MTYAATLTQQGIFSGGSSITGILYKFNNKGKSDTNTQIGVLSRSSSASRTLMNPLQELDRLIMSFSQLEYGWNGDSARPIPASVIANSQQLLKELTSKLPEIYPTGRESIQFEYDKDDKSLEIEIFSNEFEITLYCNDEILEEESFKIEEKSVANNYISKLYE